MSNPAVNPSAIRTARHDHSQFLKSYSVQCTDAPVYPYGTFNQPCYSYDQALSVLLERKAVAPAIDFHILESHEDHFDGLDHYLFELAADMSKPFHASWALQILANQAITAISELDDDARTAKVFHAASEACFRAANILNSMTPNFKIKPESWANPARYYEQQADHFFDIALGIECESLAVEVV